MQINPVDAVPEPVGIGGRISIDGVWTNGLNITVTNENSGSFAETYTQSTPQGDGYYAVALTAEDGDKLNLTMWYNSTLYSNYTLADTDLTTQWINLSIVTAPGENWPEADFSWSPTDIYVNQIIQFLDTSEDLDNDIVSWVWGIDGTVYTTQNPSHIFLSTGYKTVTLTVTDSQGHVDIASKTVKVKSGDPPPPPPPPDDNPPNANFVWSPSIVVVGDNVTFTDTSTDPDNDIIDWTWTILGETIEDVDEVTRQFMDTGAFGITLKVVDSKGNHDTQIKTLNVYEHVNESNESHISITVKVKDDDQEPIEDALVEFFNVTTDDKVEEVSTNETGVGVVFVPDGEYRVTASYDDKTETKELEFFNDAIVLFVMDLNPDDNGGNGGNNNNPDDTPSEGDDGFLGLPGFEIPVFILAAIITVVLILRKRK
jgi:PKD repeat protein